MKPIRSGAKVTLTNKQAAYSGEETRRPAYFLWFRIATMSIAVVRMIINSSYVDISIHPFYRIRTDDCTPFQLPW